MDAEDYLQRLLPHRLDALAILALMLEFRLKWEEPKRMQIFVEGRPQFEGTTSMFLNPIFEAGILHIRALLEFLGLKASKAGRLANITPSERRSDDAAIELLRHEGRSLPLVTPEQAYAIHPSDPRLAEACYVSAITAANKGMAHFSVSYNPVEAQHVLLVSRLTQQLVERHVYQALGRLRPPIPLGARARP
jgi:hypothetical protein